jgi:hypothetical protein
MSTPVVNTSINLQDARLRPADLTVSPLLDSRLVSPFLKSKLDFSRIVATPPAPAAPESLDIHGEDGSVIGTVSYTPGDFASMQAAAEKLMKEGNQEDFVEGQKLLNRAFQLLQIEMLMESLRQQIFNQMIQSLQQAAG